MDAATERIVNQVAPFTMTGVERRLALLDAIAYIAHHRIPGAVVECGVWRGGSMMAAALALQEHGDIRDLYLFDTFEGMTPPGEFDREFTGRMASDLLAADPTHTSDYWAVASLEQVRVNMRSTGYPQDRMHFVEGPVEATIPERAPATIALLRLDTDWYESTRHELVHLYPRIPSGGVLIIDDYGHFEGARKAADEYLEETGARVLLNRIDYTGRIAVVP
jgi:O-methyltransferase